MTTPGETVCSKPVDNGACLVLPRIAEMKREECEAQYAGRRIDELTDAELPACIAERATFMSPFSIQRIVKHPYQKSNGAHRHILPTPLHMSPFSAAAVRSAG